MLWITGYGVHLFQTRARLFQATFFHSIKMCPQTPSLVGLMATNDDWKYADGGWWPTDGGWHLANRNSRLPHGACVRTARCGCVGWCLTHASTRWSPVWPWSPAKM